MLWVYARYQIITKDNGFFKRFLHQTHLRLMEEGDSKGITLLCVPSQLHFEYLYRSKPDGTLEANLTFDVSLFS